MAKTIVELPYKYFPDPTKGRPVFNGSVFIGEPDTDPEIEVNRKEVTLVQEDGTEVPILPAGQPLLTGAGGVVLFEGSPVIILVVGDYSIKVLNNQGSQVYFAASVSTELEPTDNFDGLRAFTSQSDGDVVTVLGHTAAGDGGGGTPGEAAPSVLGDITEPPEGGGEPKPAGEPKGAEPATVADLKITLPQGAQMDDAVLKDVSPALSKAGLDNEKASELVAWQLERQAAQDDASAKAWVAQGEQWLKDLSVDKDFGGEKLDQNLADAKKGIRHFGGQVLSDELARMGLGNHPELIKTFARIGAAMAEDSSLGGGNAAPATGPEAERQAQLRERYPSMYNADGSPKR